MSNDKGGCGVPSNNSPRGDGLYTCMAMVACEAVGHLVDTSEAHSSLFYMRA